MKNQKMPLRSELNIRSANELVNEPVPEIKYRVLDILRANGGRMSLTGQYKMKKSFLALHLGLKVAAGEEWLCYKTMKGTVLYVNLEISGEKFQERTQDLQQELDYTRDVLDNFLVVTILDRNLSLDESVQQIQGILNHCSANGKQVDMLILDPRARIIFGSENEEATIKGFCDNIDLLLANNPGLSVVIVTHMGKDPSKGAIGHSRYSGWLDTEITISEKGKGKDKIQRLAIRGRDTESATIRAKFNYPLHEVVTEQQEMRKSKVQEAIDFIIVELTQGNQPEQQLRGKARAKDITDYAFHTAIRELKDEGKLKTIKAGGQGNRKLLKFVEENEG